MIRDFDRYFSSLQKALKDLRDREAQRYAKFVLAVVHDDDDTRQIFDFTQAVNDTTSLLWKAYAALEENENARNKYLDEFLTAKNDTANIVERFLNGIVADFCLPTLPPFEELQTI